MSVSVSVCVWVAGGGFFRFIVKVEKVDIIYSNVIFSDDNFNYEDDIEKDDDGFQPVKRRRRQKNKGESRGRGKISFESAPSHIHNTILYFMRKEPLIYSSI